jgi:hypothetical protein
MDDKSSKMSGEPVSNVEVIADLGHPSGWLANSMQIEIRNRLVKGNVDLDIAGIRGYGLFVGYLGFLRKQLERPIGTDTGLVPPEVEAQIRSDSEAVLTAEIKKYEDRLAELERSPAELSRCLERMRDWLDTLENNSLFAERDPLLEPIEELQELARDSNRQNTLAKEQLRAQIESYADLLTTLT